MSDNADSELIQILLKEDDDSKHHTEAFSLLMSWIAGDSLSPLPPSSYTNTENKSPHVLQSPSQSTPSSFAISFVEYLRSESERVLAAKLPITETCTPSGDAQDATAFEEKYNSKSPMSRLPPFPENAASYSPIPSALEEKLNMRSPANRLSPCIQNSASSYSSPLEKSHTMKSPINKMSPASVHHGSSNSEKSDNSSHSEEKHKMKSSASRMSPVSVPIKPEHNSYDADFPVLGVSNHNVPLKAIAQQQAKPKRRVNPTPTQDPVVDSAFVFANIETNKSTYSNAPKSRSLAPVKVDMDALMQRCQEKRKSKPKTVEITNTSTKINAERSDATISNQHSVDKESSRRFLHIRSSIPRLKRFATVHCKLMNEKLVPSLIGELQYLFQLLGFGQCKNQHCGKEDTERNLFICSDECSLYACIVMEQLGRILESVGEPLLPALINHPVLAQNSPALQKRLQGALVSHQATSLHSFKSYKVCNAVGGHSQSVDTLGMPISLPFQAERDSRNNYKSRESQVLYNNREVCRDHFYAIIREAASLQNSFGYTIDDCRLKIQEGVRSLMSILVVENYPWFTELFLEQFVQVAMCGETDPVVTGLARQDPMKLQKLHDRLTLGHRNKATGSSMTGNSAYKVNSNVESKGSIKVLNSSAHTYRDGKADKYNQAGTELTSFFPSSLRVYVWIIEAADSYRLSMQMIWSLKYRICKMTEIPQHSRDAADIGSVLTRRVLSLKALSSLLGFLCVFPGAGPRSQGFELVTGKTDPPIDVAGMLEKAKLNGTMLLTLPWVLDFLRLIKADSHVLSLPYFQKAIKAVRDVHNYSILDPKSDSFGVASMCLLALLDGFFEAMDLPGWSICFQQNNIESAMETGTEPDFKTSGGLDRITGVIDASYIQQCCPRLMGLRMLLMDSDKQPQNSNTTGTDVVHAKSLRKITPVHHPKSSQLADQGAASSLEDSSASSDNYVQVKLQQTFFEQRQELQRLVDFVVDTTAVNAARAASLKCVPSVLVKPLKVLQIMVRQKLQIMIDTENELQYESKLEATVENMITSAIQEALVPAMDYAKKHAAERVSEALAALASPDEIPYVLGIAARIAADAAGSAACKKTLANISCDIRKRITQEVENWKHNFHNSQKQNVRDKKLGEQTVASNGISLAFGDLTCAFAEEKENTQSSDFTVERNLLVLGAEDVQRLKENCFLPDRTQRCCSAVVELCSDCLSVDKQRYQLRLSLAAVCTSIEAILSSHCEKLPQGGFDAIVYGKEDINIKDMSQFENLESMVTSSLITDETENKFRIEIGLTRRSVALSLFLCLQFPLQAFGYSQETLVDCICSSVRQQITKFNVSKEVEDVFNKVLKVGEQMSEEYSCAERTTNCRTNNHLGGLMFSLVAMWEALAKCGICSLEVLVCEFMFHWRWIQALQYEPWRNNQVWSEAVIHGIANVLFKLTSLFPPNKNKKPVIMLVEDMCNVFCTQDHNAFGIKSQNVGALVCSILLQLLYLHNEGGHS